MENNLEANFSGVIVSRSGFLLGAFEGGYKFSLTLPTGKLPLTFSCKCSADLQTVTLTSYGERDDKSEVVCS